MSTVFLFGAGASAFSGPCHPTCPPLGDDLFAALKKAGGIAATLDPSLVAVFENNGFEAGMARFREVRDVDTPELLRDTAAYLSQFAPGPQNCYRQLINALVARRHAAVLATLNYDVLIELAVHQTGMGVEYGAVTRERDNMPVLKLHGSCNFLPDVGTNQFINCRAEGGGDPTNAWMEPPAVRAVSAAEVRHFCRTEDSLAPVMACYAHGKPTPFAPTFVRGQQEKWRAALKSASSVYVIGVRVVPDDAHVWEPLRATKAAIGYVGPEDGPFHEWAAGASRRLDYTVASSFDAAVPIILRELTNRRRFSRRPIWR